jgi:two-component system cell cycle response regulator CpdR
MRTILLAEDDESMRRFLAKALERAGYEVISYGNGVEAFEGLKEKPVKLLLADIVMPQMDGIELAKRASELDPEMKIMFITGFAAVALQPTPSQPATVASQQTRILSKPIHLKDLVREVDKMLAA